MADSLRHAARSARYIGVNLSKNALAPVVLPLMPSYTSTGLDGVLAAATSVLERVTAPGLAALGGGLDGRRVVELGPGHTPEIMVALVLAGAERADGFDTEPRFPDGWRSPDRYEPLAEELADGRCPAFLDAAGTTTDRVAARFEELRRVGLPVELHRYDGASTGLASGSVDLVLSKSALEHVDATAVERLIAELRRVVRMGGGMIHFIDLRDHIWIAGDDEVTGDWLQALRYPEWLFQAMFSRRAMYINRLRADEWRRLFEAAGFAVRWWRETPFPLDEDFSRRRLRPRWRALTDAELSTGLIEVALTLE